MRASARHDPPERQVVFTVADTGAGISEANLSRVVEPLFTTKPVGEGTGLGLAIAREIVSSHRGELALAPRTFGRHGGHCLAAARRLRPRPEGRTLAERARVLVVDDNLEMARTLCDGLGDHGYQAIAVSSGAEAIARLEAGGVDAVVTDLRMPNVDGLAVLESSRRLEPGRPVIIMTAFSAIDSAVESIRRGANHYLTKPFKQDELLIFLERALGEVRLRREAAALKRELGGRLVARAIVGDSPPIRALRELVARVADAPAPDPDPGRNGHRQGAGGPRPARRERSRRGPLRLGQLRGDPRGAAGERAVRLRARRLHRRGARSRRASSPRRPAGRCSSTRSARCRSRFRPSCCT